MAVIARASLLVAAVLGLSFVAGTAITSGHQAKSSRWVTIVGTTVYLKLIAGYDESNAGFNFNGRSHGQMTITVPEGDTVDVAFRNETRPSLPHSAQFVAYATTPPKRSVPDAFAGANSPNPTVGVMPGTIQKFSFVANEAGKFLLICAVPGHALAGMWDVLKVSKVVTVPSVVLQ